MTNFQQAAKVLSKELEDKGYRCRLEVNHPHPRLYVASNGSERFTVLSSTANYDEGNLLNMKRQDIARDVLPHLSEPIPTTLPPVPATNLQSDVTPALIADSRVFPIKVFIIGKGVLAIRVPEEATPEKARLAQVVNFKDNNTEEASSGIRMGLIFSPEHGVKPSATRKVGTLAYYFARAKVPFKYAHRQPSGFQAPALCARRMGDSLVCDKPLPRELLEDKARMTTTPAKHVTKADTRPKTAFKLEDGAILKEMINEWIEWARKVGHEPKLTVRNGKELHISVTIKTTKEL